MAHITKRSGRWQATWRDPDRRERTKTFSRKVEAEHWLASIEHSKLDGSYVDPAAGRVTFRQFAEQWRRIQVHRPGTQKSVEQQLRLHVYPTIGDRPMASVRPTDVQALVRRLTETLAPGTVQVVYGRVVAVFRAAVRDRVIATSPCGGVRLPPRAGPGIGNVLEPAQVQAIADAIEPRYKALVITGAALGLRPGELFGLALDRIDFLRRAVKVDQQIVRLPSGGVGLGPLKTPSSYRSVPLPDVAAVELSRHVRAFQPHPGLGLIFTTARGGLVQEHPFSSVWETAKRTTKAPGWASPHDLRHFYASLLIRAGASVKVVQARLGHASAKTTLDTYGHLWSDDEDRTRAAVDQILGTTTPLKAREVSN